MSGTPEVEWSPTLLAEVEALKSMLASMDEVIDIAIPSTIVHALSMMSVAAHHYGEAFYTDAISSLDFPKVIAGDQRPHPVHALESSVVFHAFPLIRIVTENNWELIEGAGGIISTGAALDDDFFLLAEDLDESDEMHEAQEVADLANATLRFETAQEIHRRATTPVKPTYFAYPLLQFLGPDGPTDNPSLPFEDIWEMGAGTPPMDGDVHVQVARALFPTDPVRLLNFAAALHQFARNDFSRECLLRELVHVFAARHEDADMARIAHGHEDVADITHWHPVVLDLVDPQAELRVLPYLRGLRLTDTEFLGLLQHVAGHNPDADDDDFDPETDGGDVFELGVVSHTTRLDD